MAVAQLNEAYPFSASFFNATTGAERADLTVNADLVNPAGTTVLTAVPVTPTGNRYVYTPAANVLNSAGKWFAVLTPTVTTNVAPVVRIVEVHVGQTWITRIDAAISSITGTTPAQIWDYLTSAANVAGSMKEYILAKLGMINPSNVTYTNPVNPNTDDLTLYNQDYMTTSGIVLPTWEHDSWEVYNLLTAQSIKLYYQTKDAGEDVEFGTLTALSNKKVQLTIEKPDVMTLPLGQNAAGIKIVAVLNATTNGGDTEELVNAGLNHINYRKNAGG